MIVRTAKYLCNTACNSHQKLTLDDFKQIAKERGGECLSDTYINSDQKLTWKCAQGHIWQAEAWSVKKGNWCRICGRKTAGDKMRGNLESLIQIAEKKGGKCLSKIYVNSNSPLLWECAKGHQWSASAGNVKSGHWCGKCYHERRKKT